MSKTALITGITGQDGAYLARHLLDKGYTVYGGARLIPPTNIWRLDALGIADDIRFVPIDLTEQRQLNHLIEQIAPDELYNLAAESFVAKSFDEPVHTGNVDALGVARILEALFRLKAPTRFYQASTSEMFGKVRETPQTELTPFHPRSPYGVAKLYAHWLTVNYREAHDLFTCSGILFNHESPLRGENFVTRKITIGLARIKQGQQSHLELGNLNVHRDWGFAGDYVDGMWRMLQQDKGDDYILATGRTFSLQRYVEDAGRVFDMHIVWKGDGLECEGIDRKSGRTIIRVNPAFYRPADVDLVLGNPAKAEEKLGWHRTVEFGDLVRQMAEADYDRVAKGLLKAA